MNRRRYLAGTGVVLGGGLFSVQTVQATDKSEAEEYVQGNNDVDIAIVETETDEHVTYLDSEEKVEFAFAKSGDEVTRYETTDWEDWVELRCRNAAVTAAREYVDDELELHVGGGISSSVEGHDSAAFVSVHLAEDESLEIAELAAITPEEISVTYELEENTSQMDVPIFATVRPEEDTEFMDLVAEGDVEPGDDGDVESGVTQNGTNGNGTENESDDDDNTDDGSTDSDDTASNDGFGPGFGIGGTVVSVGGLYYLLRERTPGN